MATPWWMAPQTQDETFTDFNVPPATQTFPMMIGDFITGMPLTDEDKRKREEERARLEASQAIMAPVVVEAEKEQPFSGLMGELGVRPRGEAPFQTMTPAREMQIGSDNQMVPVLGQGMLDYYEGNVPDKVIERAPYVSGRGFETEGAKQEKQQKKEADRIWGNFSYNPEESRKRYEDSMKDIYVKSMLLNGIAQLTGGKSQASAFVEMATKRMEMEEAFRDQSRLQNIQRGIYYTQDGLYDPPKNQQEAFDRAMKFGASAELASKISGYTPEDTRAYNNWYRIVDGRLEETVSRKGVKPEGEGWKKGTYSAPSGSGGTETERALDRVDALVAEGNVAGAVQELERVFAYKAAGDITSKQPNRLRDAVDIVWKSISPSLKIPVPENIETVEQLAAWEAEQKASGVRGYYRFGDELGIIQ